MFEFLLDGEYWRNAIAYAVVFHQAGFNMIPQFGWQQAIEAWATDKIKEN